MLSFQSGPTDPRWLLAKTVSRPNLCSGKGADAGRRAPFSSLVSSLRLFDANIRETGERFMFPESTGVQRLLIAKGLRAFGDGYVSVLLPLYLVDVGFSPLQVGVIAT